MRKTRWLAAFFLPFILVSFLQSQSLAELAKKEKERRAALKGRTAKVITTADLAKVKKRPAVETVAQEQAIEEGTETVPAVEAAGQVEAQATPPTVATGEAAAAGTPAVKPTEEPKPQAAPPAEPPAAPERDARAQQAELTKSAQDKRELVDLLTLKMNALYQELYSLDNVKSRELLQAQISDTYDKLLRAESESNKADKDLADFLAALKKEQTPGIWIK